MRFPFEPKYITGKFGTLSEFRRKNGMQPHSGVDWARPEGTPIPAIANGTIVLQQWSDILGHVSVLRVMGVDKKLYYIGYCHLAAEGLEVGTKVSEGDVVGKIGGGKKFPSGSASTGGHLHLTVSRELKGVFGPVVVKRDPIEFIKANKKVTK
jgi:murein DD-endopeptidase MepM/ murein hydrolase activator NlpD